MSEPETVREFLIQRGQNPQDFEKILDMQIVFYDGFDRCEKEVIDVKRIGDCVITLETLSVVRGLHVVRRGTEVVVHKDSEDDVYSAKDYSERGKYRIRRGPGAHERDFNEALSVRWTDGAAIVRVKSPAMEADIRCELEEDG